MLSAAGRERGAASAGERPGGRPVDRRHRAARSPRTNSPSHSITSRREGSQASDRLRPNLPCRSAGFRPCILVVTRDERPRRDPRQPRRPALHDSGNLPVVHQRTPSKPRLRETRASSRWLGSSARPRISPRRLRLICHELARLTGAETVSAHLLDARTGELRPIAAHGVPKHAVEALAASTLAAADLAGLERGVRQARMSSGATTLPKDRRFAAGPFPASRTSRPSLIPLVFDGRGRGRLLPRVVESGAAASSRPSWPRSRPSASRRACCSATRGCARRSKGGPRACARCRASTRSSPPRSTRARCWAAIARAAAELTGAPFVSFWVADRPRAGSTLGRGVGRAARGPICPSGRWSFGQGSVGWVAAERRILEVVDVFADPRFTEQGWWQGHGFTSFVGVPVVLEGTLLAVLALCGRWPFSLGRRRPGAARELRRPGGGGDQEHAALRGVVALRAASGDADGAQPGPHGLARSGDHHAGGGRRRCHALPRRGLPAVDGGRRPGAIRGGLGPRRRHAEPRRRARRWGRGWSERWPSPGAP